MGEKMLQDDHNGRNLKTLRRLIKTNVIFNPMATKFRTV